MAPPPPSLNHKQRAFAHQYVSGEGTKGNATASAIAAGYSQRTAHVQGHDLLKNPKVAALVAELEEKSIQKIQRTANHVLEELARLGFSDVTAIFNDDGTLKHPKDMPVEVRRAIKSIEFEELWEGNKSDTAAGEDKGRFVIGRIVKVVLHSKEKGLELLGKNLKLFTDKVEHEVSESLESLILESFKGDKK